ncbi:MAG: putative DNA binding domain-containing protein [Candidatus Tectomicrobia bacterium]|nr:putative DNA binding domain-containing protein [Candidatus Tectomicrobia bacterium]
MNQSELHMSIASGEDSFTEFKRDISQRSDFASEMIAFANMEGGRILVGVDDSGTIAGVKAPQRVEEAILNIARHNCVPPLSPTVESIPVEGGKIVVVVEVPRRLEAPHENNSGQCYIRVGSTKRLCTPQERARLLQAASLIHFDEIPMHEVSSDDLELSAFGEYYERIYEQPLDAADVPLIPMLENMRFLVTDLRGESRLSLAGLLLFGKQPQDFLSHAYISAVRWEGVEAGETIIDRQDIMGRLPQQIEHAEAFILRNTRLSTKIESVRQEDRREYPRAVIREAIVNAVVHRDYSLEGAQTLLYIFDNRLEIRSPGALPNSVTLDNIRTHYSKPRNETIARVLLNLGYVNRLGSGIPRMIRLMREHTGREPDFEVGSAQFLVRLWSA